MIQIGHKKKARGVAVKAGLAGAVIGATGAAIGMAMKDKKTRDTVKEKIEGAKKWTEDQMDRMGSDIEKKADTAKKQAVSETKKVKSKTSTS